jgi:hypothetical protein
MGAVGSGYLSDQNCQAHYDSSLLGNLIVASGDNLRLLLCLDVSSNFQNVASVDDCRQLPMAT